MYRLDKPEWTKRPTKSTTETSVRRTWRIKGSDHKVIEAKSTVGMPLCYYAVHGEHNTVISRHRSKNAAFKACEKHWRQS